ncbi:hypothetical protein DXG01_010831 [Tephrocybe rancida]|nr:hypothetical protein DXG01_010831 [Tephrocybe rancida]
MSNGYLQHTRYHMWCPRVPSGWDQTTPPTTIGPLDRRGIVTVEESPLAPTTKRGLQSNAEAAKKLGNQCSCFHVPPGAATPPLLPDNVQAWQDGNREGPTADQIAADSTVRQVFQDAWERSFPAANVTVGRLDLCQPSRSAIDEQPSILNADLWLIDPTHDFWIVSATNLADDATASRSIDLSAPDIEGIYIPEDFLLVATFHTHPTPDHANSNENDNTVAWRQGVPGFIIHELGLTAFGPPARAQIQVPAANRYFPNTNEQNPQDNRYDIGQPIPGWKPACVPNQPLGAGSSQQCSGELR